MPRNKNGQGCISKRKDNTYMVRIQNGRKADGTINVITKYSKTQKEAKLILKSLQKNLIMGKLQSSENATIQQYGEWFLENIKKPNIQNSSYDRVQSTFVDTIVPHVTNLTLGGFSTNDGQTIINTLAKKYSYSSLKKSYDFLYSMFKYAIRTEKIQKNPMEHVVLPVNMKKEKSDIQYFNKDEVMEIIKVSLEKWSNGTYRYKYGLLMVLLVSTGLRIGEALALEWSDLNNEEHTLSVNKTLTTYKATDNENKNMPKRVFDIKRGGKTASSTRTIGLNDSALYAISEIDRLKTSDKLIISSKSGKIARPRNVDRCFRTILARCGLPSRGVHTLRHSFATLLYEEGEETVTVSEILGHSDTSITGDIYLHVSKGKQKTAVHKLDWMKPNNE